MMIVLIVAIWAFIITLAFAFVARANGELKARLWEANQVKPIESPKAICLCGHAISFHQNSVGRCVETINLKQHTVWATKNYDYGWVNGVQCKCLVYTGPEPLPEYYHPLEISA